MRWIAVLAALVALSWAAAAGAEDEPKKKAKAEPPPAGIWWAPEFQPGLVRAMKEGRPVLLCVNALESERANQQLAFVTYRSAPWGRATRGYVAFVCNPEDHASGGTKCSRYERHTCTCHREALTWFLARFGPNLISPQHVILEPDGDVAYRKEYYEGVVTPALLEGYLSKIAPRIAYSRAGIGREKKMKTLAGLELDGIDAFAKSWLAGDDGLAAAAMLNVLDDASDAAKRLAIIAALRHTHDLQVPVLVYSAEERVLYPGDEPTETLAWIRTLFAADRAAGVWAATRALVRFEDEASRSAILQLWAGRDATQPVGIKDLPAKERPAAFEALILAGDKRGRQGKAPAAWTEGREAEIARARLVAGLTTPTKLDLAGSLKTARPGPLRRALLGADKATVRAHEAAIVKGIQTWNNTPLRIAGALALFGIRDPASPAKPHPHRDLILPVLMEAIADPIEGPPTKREIGRYLGQDQESAGDVSLTTWRKLLLSELGGAK